MPVAVLAGVRNMDCNVHMHVENVKFEFDSDKESEEE